MPKKAGFNLPWMIFLEELMARYNKEEIMVYATIQLYLSERLPYLKTLTRKIEEKKATKSGLNWFVAPI